MGRADDRLRLATRGGCPKRVDLCGCVLDERVDQLVDEPLVTARDIEQAAHRPGIEVHGVAPSAAAWSPCTPARVPVIRYVGIARLKPFSVRSPPSSAIRSAPSTSSASAKVRAATRISPAAASPLSREARMIAFPIAP